MKTVRLGGVPEYFNWPIISAIRRGKFEEAGINLEWQDITQGTGRMANMLADDELDMAILLTEGITKSIIEGNPSKLIHTYVQSPLTWGIHVPANAGIMNLKDLVGCSVAISRFGSGSHLMAILLLQSLGFDPQAFQFLVVDNLDGAREEFMHNDSVFFLWEKYTTKFLVEKGEFSRIGEWPTPWPCFVVAATNSVLEEQEAVKLFLKVLLNEVNHSLSAPDLLESVISEYSLNLEDVKSFLPATNWSRTLTASRDATTLVIKTFQDIGLLDSKTNQEVWFNFDGPL